MNLSNLTIGDRFNLKLAVEHGSDQIGNAHALEGIFVNYESIRRQISH